MQELDRDFALFARTGDPAALARVYDASAAELLALATRLVGDPVEAEDLVQATFLAAIESAGTFGAGRRAMPWLVGILTNRARRLHRARRAAAALARPLAAAARGPADLLQDEELQRSLARALDRLSPVLRPVLALRLRHGMQPAEIACALQRPPATVRSQLARGLGQLRGLLPRHLAPPAVLLVPPVRGLAAVRTAVLAQAGARAAATAATAAGAATALGGAMVMGKQVKLAVAAFAVAVLGTLAWWLPRNGPSLPPGPRGGEPVAATAATGPARPGGGTAGSSDAAPRDVRTVAAGPAALHVRVVCAQRPIPGAVVVVRPGDDLRTAPRLCIVTGADGVARFADLPAGRGFFHLFGTPPGLRYAVAPGAVAEGTIEAPQPGFVRGRVLFDAAVAAADATVWVGAAPQGAGGVFDAFAPRADGRFDLALWSAALVGARSPGTIAVHHEAAPAPGETVELTLHLRRGGAALRGRVVERSTGSPVAGAAVEIGDRFGWFLGRLRPDGSRESVLPRACVTDAHGRFLADGLLAGTVAVHGRARGLAPAWTNATLPPGGEAEVTLELERGCRVHGRVAHTDGRPAAGAAVRCGLEGSFGAVGTVTDGDGRYELADVPAGPASLHASLPPWGQATAHPRLEPGTDFEWNAALDPYHDRVDGRLVDAQGRPLPGWWVVAHTDSRHDAGSPALVGDDGAFALGPFLGTPELELRVHPRGARGGAGSPETQAVYVKRGVRPGVHDLAITVPDTALPSAWLRGRLVHPSGTRRGPVLVGESGTARAVVAAAGGAFQFGPLAPGRWRIVLPLWPQELELAAVDLLPGDNRDLGEVAVPAVTAGELHVELPPFELPPGFRAEFDSAAAVQVLLADGLRFVRWANVDRGTTRLHLLPGRYVLRVVGVPLAPVAHECEVRAGETTRVLLQTRPAAMRRVAFRHPGGGHPFDPLALEVRDSRGRIVWNAEVPSHNGWWLWELNLEPGSYELRARTENGLACDVPLRIEAADLGLRPLVFALEER